jgi:hypothetical protein
MSGQHAPSSAHPIHRGAARAFLIFGGSNTRAVVAFCRALAARGLDSAIVARTDQDPILKTRYRRQVVATRALDSLDFDDIDRCIGEARRKMGTQEFVISPASEFLNLFLLEHRDFFASRGCIIPLVDLDLYRCVSDKHSFSRICHSRGIAIPREISIGDSPRLPFVAKPLHNVTADKRSLYPHLIFTPEDLARFQRAEDSADYYFEEFVVGPSFYLLYYLSRQGAVTAWSQQNLLQQPGGKSIVLAKSARVHQDPIRRGDEFVFIELNPRFWGPFQLLTNAGSPVVDRFIDDQLGLEPAPYPPPARPAASYLWLGGMADSLASGKTLAWHVDPPKHKVCFIARHWRSDVYLRPDTGRLFLHEFAEAARKLPFRRAPLS